MGVWVTIDDHAVFIENAKGPYERGKDGKITYTGKDHKGGKSKAVASGPGSSKHEPVPSSEKERDPNEGKLDEKAAIKLKSTSYKALMPDEIEAVESWSGGGYSVVRKIDREGAAASAAGPHYLKVHENMYKALPKLPQHTGTTYRGIANLTEEQVETLRNSSTVGLDAVSSFSRRPSVGHDFMQNFDSPSNKGLYSVLFKFHGTGAHVAGVSLYGEKEAEVVHKKGTQFEVTKTYWEHDGDKDHKPHLVVEGKQK